AFLARGRIIRGLYRLKRPPRLCNSLDPGGVSGAYPCIEQWLGSAGPQRAGVARVCFPQRIIARFWILRYFCSHRLCFPKSRVWNSSRSGESRDQRTERKVRAAGQHPAAALPREKVYGAAVVPLLVSQQAHDQLRRGPGGEREHRPGGPGVVARGAARRRPSFRQLHLRGQQRHARARHGAHLQRRQSRGHAAQPRQLALGHRLLGPPHSRHGPQARPAAHLRLRGQLRMLSENFHLGITRTKDE
ncbi:unnamed protein product, partial [Trichogramma brassicae]